MCTHLDNSLVHYLRYLMLKLIFLVALKQRLEFADADAKAKKGFYVRKWRENGRKKKILPAYERRNFCSTSYGQITIRNSECGLEAIAYSLCGTSGGRNQKLWCCCVLQCNAYRFKYYDGGSWSKTAFLYFTFLLQIIFRFLCLAFTCIANMSKTPSVRSLSFFLSLSPLATDTWRVEKFVVPTFLAI